MADVSCSWSEFSVNRLSQWLIDLVFVNFQWSSIVCTCTLTAYEVMKTKNIPEEKCLTAHLKVPW